jgi:hypothetical protein
MQNGVFELTLNTNAICVQSAQNESLMVNSCTNLFSCIISQTIEYISMTISTEWSIVKAPSSQLLFLVSPDSLPWSRCHHSHSATKHAARSAVHALAKKKLSVLNTACVFNLQVTQLQQAIAVCYAHVTTHNWIKHETYEPHKHNLHRKAQPVPLLPHGRNMAIFSISPHRLLHFW